MEPILQTAEFNDLTDFSFTYEIKYLMKQLFLTWACKFNMNDCNRNSAIIFDRWQKEPSKEFLER